MTFAAHSDPWLAEVMSRPVFRVDGGGATSDLASHIAAQTGAFYFAKVPTESVDDVGQLTRLGFAVVDTNVTFEYTDDDTQYVVDAIAMPRTATVDMRKPGTGEAAPKTDHLNIGEIKPAEADAVLDIAGSAFRYSRFHLDPRIDVALAHKIKREWIRNYVLGKRGAGLLVAREAGQPIGFLAHLITRGTAVIDLIAVANDAHGRGAGSALTAAFAGLYAGMPRIVGTQIANLPSIRLYTRLGFAFSRSQYVLHLHAGT
jgi:ribosomal protein S18 acetylase RimI-like enzyme